MDSRHSRRGFLAAAGVTALAGCLGGRGGPATGGTADDPTRQPATAAAGDDPTASATRAPATSAGSGPPVASDQLPLPMAGDALRGEALSGGPPKDGIPSVDDPKFIDSSAADETLAAGDIVFGVARGDVAKAYPQSVLVWHEVANDVIDGAPISITYCPLTGTAQGFDRGDTTFGVSGRLLNNNLIMYDRATENWWPQVLATAIPGPWAREELAGRSLSEFRVIWTTWANWKAQYPDTRVLSTDTGYARNYDRDPYGTYNPRGGYYDSDSLLFPPLNRDDRFGRKTVVMGVRTPDGAAAVPKARLREQGVVTGAIAGRSLLWAYGADLDTGYAYWNPDGREFTYQQGAVNGADGPHDPDDLPLERALTFDAMWFAWAGFYPETSVHG